MSYIEDSLVVFALCSRDVPSSASALVARDMWPLIDWARDQDMALSAVITEKSCWPEALRSELRERARTRLADVVTARDVLSSYAEAGLWALTPWDSPFPARLRARLGVAAPCLLYGAGESALLAQDGIGVVGSRNITTEGEHAARAIANAALGEGLPVISGGARGADQTAMDEAIDHGGMAVGVLAHPLTRVARQDGTAVLIEEGRLCLISPFKPDAGFSVAGAMARNRVIYGLARATCVVAADLDKGGTWRGATEALSKRYGTVAVWRGPGAGPGNAALVARGAHEVRDGAALVRLPPIPMRDEQLPLGAGRD